MEGLNIMEIGGLVTTVLISLHALAVVIVNLTDTPADDEFVGKAYKVIEILAGIFGDKAKQLPGEEL